MGFIAADKLIGKVLVVAQPDLLGELVGGASVRVGREGLEGLEGLEGVIESWFEEGVVETFNCRLCWIRSTWATMSGLCLLSWSWSWTVSRR